MSEGQVVSPSTSVAFFNTNRPGDHCSFIVIAIFISVIFISTAIVIAIHVPIVPIRL